MGGEGGGEGRPEPPPPSIVYNLTLHDDNFKNMGVNDWKWVVKSTTYRNAFWELKA